MKIRLLAVIGACLIPNLVSASECSKLESTREANDCITKEYEAVDKLLNADYSQFRKLLSPEEKERLKEAQVAWLKYKDLDCQQESERYYGNGSLAPYVETQCQISKMKIRIEELKRHKDLKEEM